MPEPIEIIGLERALALVNRQSDQYQRVGDVLRSYFRPVPELPAIPSPCYGISPGDNLAALLAAVEARHAVLEWMGGCLEALFASLVKPRGKAH
jgi:hypothetical protein